VFVVLIEIKKKSVIPLYCLAGVWVLYCLIFPVYKTWHFIVLVGVGALVYSILLKLFPGKVELIEVPQEPERTGDEKLDDLLTKGETTVDEMRRLRSDIPAGAMGTKADELIDITDKIFRKLLVEPKVYEKVKRFSDFFLPTSVKLLTAYVRFGQSGLEGENITGTKERIGTALDMTLNSYNKFFDSLFEEQALDIETDIKVLETLLRRDGLLERDF